LAIAARNKIGLPDLLTLSGAEVLLSAQISDRFDQSMSPVKHRPERMLIEDGIGSKSFSTFRFLVRGEEGKMIGLEYNAEKARDIEVRMPLRAKEFDWSDE
jgi:hypothetical protein